MDTCTHIYQIYASISFSALLPAFLEESELLSRQAGFVDKAVLGDLDVFLVWVGNDHCVKL